MIFWMNAVLLGCATDVPPAAPASATEEASVEATPIPTVSEKPPTLQRPGGFALSSTSFSAGGDIPQRLTCDGLDTSPALAWADVPEGTKSLALVVVDPDAPDPARPRMTWVHWVAYDLPPETRSLNEGASGSGMPTGSRVGSNDFRNTGYGGPCPAVGKHRYIHTLYALDTTLGDQGPLARVPLGKAMEGHILGEASITGLYERAKE